jgi:hypothetical protein
LAVVHFNLISYALTTRKQDIYNYLVLPSL